MANYVGYARSNEFGVTDLDGLREALAPLSIELIEEKPGRVILLSHGEGGWPTSYYDEDLDDMVTVDLTATIAGVLAEGEVAVLMEVGAEKLRYLIGYATAINAAGETRTLGLEGIWPLARELGANVEEF